MQFRTGELVLESGNNIGSILFHEGKILQAISPYSRAIGDLMVEDGLISEAELLDALMLQKKSVYSPLGELLLKNGKVTIGVIEKMVQEQIRESLKEFLSWKDVNFSFVKKDIQSSNRMFVLSHEFISPDTLRSAAIFLSMRTP
jgi:hypothetical protein